MTRVAGRNHGLHTAATATLTAYHIDEHGRSGKSIAAFGILPRFTGVAMHDACSAYAAAYSSEELVGVTSNGDDDGANFASGAAHRSFIESTING